MSDASEEVEDQPKKSSKLPLILGLVLALVGGGGGFFATWSGMILAPGGDEKSAEETVPDAKPTLEVVYVEVDPLVISLPRTSSARHLRFRAHLEVSTEAQEAVGNLVPRVVDVLNSYLRALDPSVLENPASLARLRAQMLRRVQVVTGPGKVRDLLIMEFVLT